MKMCLNWKVLAGLGAAGVGLYLVASELAVAALPLLLLALCPLSMLLMMKGMQGGKCETRGRRAPQETDITDLTREEQIARLRGQQADLTDRIETLEQGEPQPAKNGKGR